MNIKLIGSNRTVLTLNSGVEILFSYETPVASRFEGEYQQTEQHYSVTTSKHINQWGAKGATKQPQAYFDRLVA